MNYSQFRAQQKSFLSTQGKIKYIDQGQGEVILLLHGVPTSSWLYRKMINELAENYRVIAPDMLGFGASDSPKGYTIYEPKEHAKRLLELMDSLQIQTWHHVLHDASGLWTWELFKQAPEKISKLIVLNTIIFKEGFNPPIRFKKGFLARCIMAMYSNGITTNSMLKGLFMSGLVDDSIMTKNDIQGYKKPLREGKTKAMYQFFTNTCNSLPDYTETIKNIKIPKLLIWGKYDDFLIFDKMKDNVISSLELALENIHFLEAKHFIQEEKPKEINSHILGFLKH